MWTKETEWCLKTLIHFPSAIWFSNHDLGTSTAVREEGVDGFGVLSPKDFEDSPSLDFIEERVNFLLRDMDVLLKAWKGKEGFLEEDGQKQKFWSEVRKETVHKHLKREMKYNGYVHHKVVIWQLGEKAIMSISENWPVLWCLSDVRGWIRIVIMNLIKN